MAQAVGRPTHGFGSGQISWFVGSSPSSGSALTVRILLGIFSLSLFLSACLPLAHSLYLSLKRNKKQKQKQKRKSLDFYAIYVSYNICKSVKYK